MIHHISRATQLSLLALLIFCALSITAVRVLFLAASDYRHLVEEKVCELTGLEVEIGSFSAGTRRFNPELILKNISVPSHKDKEKSAIQLQEMRLGLDMIDFLFSADILASSWLTLVGVQITVIQQDDGSISIKGLQSDTDEQPLWLLKGGKYEILNSQLTWHSNAENSRPEVFENLSFLIKNAGEHEIHLISDLPQRYGKTLKLSAIVDGDLINFKNITGKAHIDVEQLELPALIQYVPGLPVQLKTGTSDVSAWLEWNETTLHSLTAEVDVTGLQLTGINKKPLQLDQLTAALAWQDGERGWQFAVQELNVIQGERSWLDQQLSISNSAQAQYAGTIQRLDLSLLGLLKPYFIQAQEGWSDVTDVQGYIQHLQFFVDSTQKHYAFNGRFDQLAVQQATPNASLQGLNGWIKGSHLQGRLWLNSQLGKLDLPTVFRQTVEFEKLAGVVDWQKQGGVLALHSDYLVLDTQDLALQTEFDVRVPPEPESIMADVQIAFEGRSNIKHLSRIVPAGKMGKKAVKWMDNAFLDGHINNGHVLLSGRLDDYPFQPGEGKFEAFFTINDGSLSFNSEWPALQNYQAFLHFLGDTLRIDFSHAETEKVVVKQAQVIMPSVDEADVLFIDTQLSGDIVNVLRYLQKTPLHGKVDGVLGNTTIKGKTQIAMDMEIPLSDKQDIIDGVAHLSDASLRVNAVDLVFERVQGQLQFDHLGIRAESLAAHTLGFPVSGKIIDEADATIVQIEGKSSSKQLQKQFSFLQNDFTQGRFPYHAEVRFPSAKHLNSTVSIGSNLSGLHIDLPESLEKPATQAKSLQLDLELSEGAWMPLHVNYDQKLDVDLRLDAQEGAIQSGQIVYGQGRAQATGKPGLQVQVNQSELDLSVWLAMLFPDNAQPTQQQVDINSVDLNVEQLIINQQPLGHFQLAMQRNADFWQGNIQHHLISGAFKVAGRDWDKQKSEFNLSTLDLTGLSDIEFQGQDKGSSVIPLFDISSEKLFWKGVDMGRLQMLGEPVAKGVRFPQITLNNALNTINMSAEWFVNQQGVQESRVNGQFESYEFGHFLNQFGLNDDLKETTAEISLQGGWEGALHAFTLDKLTAELQVELQGGRVSSIEPGVGRLLGLIALDQWLKRFTLDFTDIYREGMAFNQATGKFMIEQGKAFSDDILLDAVPATIKIVGTADLLNKTVDHHALVVPKSAAALPIAGTIVGKIASTLTQFVTDEYKDGFFFGSEYKLQGAWGDIQVLPLREEDGVLKKTWRGLAEFPWNKQDKFIE